MYSELVMQHFYQPRHVGELSDDENVITVKTDENTLNDVLMLQIKVNQQHVIEEVAFMAQASVVFIALCSYLTDRILGLTMEEAANIDYIELQRALELDANKHHCAMLVADMLNQANSSFLESR